MRFLDECFDWTLFLGVPWKGNLRFSVSCVFLLLLASIMSCTGLASEEESMITIEYSKSDFGEQELCKYDSSGKLISGISFSGEVIESDIDEVVFADYMAGSDGKPYRLLRTQNSVITLFPKGIEIDSTLGYFDDVLYFTHVENDKTEVVSYNYTTKELLRYAETDNAFTSNFRKIDADWRSWGFDYGYSRALDKIIVSNHGAIAYLNQDPLCYTQNTNQRELYVITEVNSDLYIDTAEVFAWADDVLYYLKQDDQRLYTYNTVTMEYGRIDYLHVDRDHRNIFKVSKDGKFLVCAVSPPDDKGKYHTSIQVIALKDGRKSEIFIDRMVTNIFM